MTLRSLAKKFIVYTIEGEYKVYRLKYTPFSLRRRFTKRYHRQLEKLPVSQRKIVFENYLGGGYGCNCKYVMEILLREPEAFLDTLDLVWIVKEPEKLRKQFPPRVRLVAYDSAEAMRELATAKLWVRNFQMVHYLNQGLLKKPGQVYIQMWHGSFGIKKIEGSCGYLNRDHAWLTLAKKNAAYTDYWISNSSFETNVYKEAFWGAGTILAYGHPRNDMLAASGAGVTSSQAGHSTQNSAGVRVENKIRQKTQQKVHKLQQEIRERYDLEDERIVLYMPTFRDSGRSVPAGFADGKLCDCLAERFGGQWKCAVRLHPRLAANLSGDALANAAAMDMAGTEAALREYRKEMKDASKPVFDVTDYPDSQELLAVADIVITDYSSAVFDFLLTGRPGFILAEDYDSYEDMRGLYYPLEETPFPVARTQDELYENIRRFDEKAYSSRVAAFLKEKGSVEDGKAGVRVAELIYKCLKQGETHKHKGVNDD